MEWDLIVMIAVLFSVAVYLLLDIALSNVVLGILVLSNAINLLLVLSSGNPATKTAAIVTEQNTEQYVDPIPQALTLTAIVIGFGLLSFFIVMLYNVFNKSDTEDISKLYGRED